MSEKITGVTPDHWLKLADLSQKSFFNRRSLEWKLAFGFWGAIAAFTSALLLHKNPALKIDTNFVKNTIPFLYFVIWLVSAFCWLLPLQKAHAGDKAWYFYYLKRANGHTKEEPESDWCKAKNCRDLKYCKCLNGLKNWFCCACWREAMFGHLVYVNCVWLVGQLIFTAIFLFLSGSLLSQRFCSLLSQ